MHRFRAPISYVIVFTALAFGIYSGYNRENSSAWTIFMIVLAIIVCLLLAAIVHPAKLGDVMIWLGLYNEPAGSKYDEFRQRDDEGYKAYVAGHRQPRRPHRCMAIRDGEPTVPLFEED